MVADDKAPDGLVWDGKFSTFHLIKTECEAKAVGMKCIHCTIVNDAARAAFPAGTVASRRKQQEKFWSFLILTFARHNSTFVLQYPVTLNECGTQLWKAIIKFYNRGSTHTKAVLRTAYRELIHSFSSKFKGDWDKYSEAIVTDLVELSGAGITPDEEERIGQILDALRVHKDWTLFVEGLDIKVQIAAAAAVAAAIPGAPPPASEITWDFLEHECHKHVCHLNHVRSLKDGGERVHVMDEADVCAHCGGKHKSHRCKMKKFAQMQKTIRDLKGDGPEKSKGIKKKKAVVSGGVNVGGRRCLECNSDRHLQNGCPKLKAMSTGDRDAKIKKNFDKFRAGKTKPEIDDASPKRRSPRRGANRANILLAMKITVSDDEDEEAGAAASIDTDALPIVGSWATAAEAERAAVLPIL